MVEMNPSASPPLPSLYAKIIVHHVNLLTSITEGILMVDGEANGLQRGHDAAEILVQPSFHCSGSVQSSRVAPRRRHVGVRNERRITVRAPLAAR
jgi:hypothetical protein